MYAVIRTGGKQYRVAAGDVISVEKLAGDPGSTISLDEVLMVGDDASQTIGTPTVDGVSVAAEVLEQTRGDKIIVFKKKRRQGYRRKAGHRQDLTVLRITDVGGTAKKSGGRRKAAAKADEPASASPAAGVAEE
jgi:large subunit ribosomal protein L21